MNGITATLAATAVTSCILLILSYRFLLKKSKRHRTVGIGLSLTAASFLIKFVTLYIGYFRVYPYIGIDILGVIGMVFITLGITETKLRK